MKTRAMLIATVALVAATMFTPARASTVGISVYDNYFTPSPTKALPGDTVSWFWTCGYATCPGSHTVTAYQGAGFSSGPLSYPSTYSAEMPNVSVVKYRCQIHSTLSGSNCNGMCGVLTQDGENPSGQIDSPKELDVFTAPGVSSDIMFAGSASDDVGVASVKVVVFDLLGRPSEFPATCPGCPTTSLSWSATARLVAGSYLAEVSVTDWVGNNYRSPRVRFVVL